MDNLQMATGFSSDWFQEWKQGTEEQWVTSQDTDLTIHS